MNDLVERLTTEQPVKAVLRPEPDARAFKAALDRRYVHIKFTETRGGTEIGVPVDPEASDLREANWDEGTGTAHLVGDLELDYEKVRFHGDIDISSLTGKGRLEVLGATDATSGEQVA